MTPDGPTASTTLPENDGMETSPTSERMVTATLNARRQHRRVPFAFKVEVRGSGDLPIIGYCQRLATSGMFIFFPVPVAPELLVLLTFTLPGESEPIKVTGRVLRSIQENLDDGTLGGMVIIFGKLAEDTEKRLEAFVLRCILREEGYEKLISIVASEERSLDTNIIPIRFFGTDHTINEYVVNISEGGAFIRTLKPLPLDTVVHLDLYIPGNRWVHRVAGRVAWHQQPASDGEGTSGMGVQFTHIPPESTAAVRAFVEAFGEDP